jgi:hypothetical protein
MTPQYEIKFYSNDVLMEEFDYTIVSDPAPNDQRESVLSKISGTVAAIAAGGVLLFGPFGFSSLPGLAIDPAAQSMVIVRAYTHNHVGLVAMPDAHQEAAARFQKLFRVVPLNDVERLKDPDYGL